MSSYNCKWQWGTTNLFYWKLDILDWNKMLFKLSDPKTHPNEKSWVSEYSLYIILTTITILIWNRRTWNSARISKSTQRDCIYLQLVFYFLVFNFIPMLLCFSCYSLSALNLRKRRYINEVIKLLLIVITWSVVWEMLQVSLAIGTFWTEQKFKVHRFTYNLKKRKTSLEILFHVMLYFLRKH
jgi:hypothetical protein